jgi:hypothetical protein
MTNGMPPVHWIRPAVMFVMVTALAGGGFGIVVVIHGRALQMIADHGANSSTLTDAAIDRLHPESTTTDDASSRTTRRSGSSNGRRSSCRSAWKAGLSTGRSIQARRTRA